MVPYLRARPARRRGVRCSRKRFYQLVSKACADLPRAIQSRLSNVAIVVEDRAPKGPGELRGPLGLYQGIPLGDRGTGYTFVLPDKVTIYRFPLLRSCHSGRELREEVRLTVLHEIGHYFGLQDDDLP